MNPKLCKHYVQGMCILDNKPCGINYGVAGICIDYEGRIAG